MFQEEGGSFYPAAPFTQSRGFLKPPGAPRMLPVLLPELSPPQTFDAGRVGSPEFRDAVYAAKELRLARQARMQASSLGIDVARISSPPPFKKSECVADNMNTKRMQTRVAVVEPHHFQVVPLREMKKRPAPALSPPAVSTRFVLKPRKEQTTSIRPESRIGTPTTSKRLSRSSMTPTNKRPTAITKTIPDRTLNNSPGLTEETLLLSQKEPSISSPITAHRGRRSTIYVAAESKTCASRRETSSPVRLAYRMRSYSTSSSIVNEQTMIASSSLRDIQTRAASSTKHRRRTQTISVPVQVTPSAVSPRKPLSGVTISVSRTSLDEYEQPKRRAVYTTAAHIDDSTPPSVSLFNDLEKHSPSLSCASITSRAGDVPGPSLTPRRRRSQVPVCSAKKPSPLPRIPLASLDLNIHGLPKPTSSSNHTSMPTHLSHVNSISRQPACFLSTDPFAASTDPVVHHAAEVSPKYHPIVVDLMSMLNAAIVEWGGDFHRLDPLAQTSTVRAFHHNPTTRLKMPPRMPSVNAATPHAPDSPRMSESPPPMGIQGDLELELLGLANALYNLGTTVINDLTKEKDKLGGGKQVGLRVNEVISHLSTIDDMAQNTQTMIPIQVLADVDNAKNPMQLTRERLERAATENQFMNGKIAAIDSYRKYLDESLAHSFPELAPHLQPSPSIASTLSNDAQSATTSSSVAGTHLNGHGP
ncbi:hypothetical protein HWV62_10759 [Athelia sp. TMB]|nr:hypothetical protein HWV62_10759 [Athelia sp. TMB]